MQLAHNIRICTATRETVDSARPSPWLTKPLGLIMIFVGYCPHGLPRGSLIRLPLTAEAAVGAAEELEAITETMMTRSHDKQLSPPSLIDYSWADRQTSTISVIVMHPQCT